MSTEAYLMCMGPLSEWVIDSLEYSASHYRGEPNGITVFASLFRVRTRSSAEVLAHALGCHISRFETHEVDVRKLLEDPERMWTLTYEIPSSEQEIADLLTLAREPGWRFFFRIDR